MNETQILTIAIAFAAPFLGVMLGVLINNSRLSDVKELIAAKVETRAAAKDVYELGVTLARVENKLDHVAETLASHSERLKNLEDKRP